VSILSNWTGKIRDTLVSHVCPSYLLSEVEEEDTSIILRILDCVKILLSKKEIKGKEKDYIDKILLLLSYKDVNVKIKAIETLTLLPDITALAKTLIEENFTIEKLLIDYKM
jgi:HEAT repeat protein